MPSPDAAIPDPQDLADQFHATFRRLRRLWTEQLAPFGITPHQWRALGMLAGRHAQGGERRDPPACGAAPEAAGSTERAGTAARAGNADPGGNSDRAGGGTPLRLSELAERLRIAPRSATEVVDQLEARGLVARAPDPRDRRATLVSLTAEGRALTERVGAVRGEQSDFFFARLAPKDRGELGRLLGILAEEGGEEHGGAGGD
ncbi:MarR family winged helix-turn-helix transcriptional regulator [Arthrobacter halodurans]|uniref:MarR family winged helix-turn-helix transcriptional regulator n=1 Tax=Arthrobacter halodurans TaxID=516699 RepID=A0ABV4UUA0_9MICC